MVRYARCASHNSKRLYAEAKPKLPDTMKQSIMKRIWKMAEQHIQFSIGQIDCGEKLIKKQFDGWRRGRTVGSNWGADAIQFSRWNVKLILFPIFRFVFNVSRKI